MIRNLTILSLVALGLCACKPTERTALKKKHAQSPVEAPAQPEPQPEEPAVVVTPPAAEPQPEPAPVVKEVQEEVRDPARCIMVVRATLQEYNCLRPWEKDQPRQARALGVYMGEGRVLTVGRAVRAATFVELMLPDASRSVTGAVR